MSRFQLGWIAAGLSALAVGVSGPSLGAGDPSPSKFAKSVSLGWETSSSTAKLVGSVVVVTSALDLSALQSSDFGDADSGER